MMNTANRVLVIVLFGVFPARAGDIPLPDGTVLTNATVLRWENGKAVIKHGSGVGSFDKRMLPQEIVPRSIPTPDAEKPDASMLPRLTRSEIQFLQQSLSGITVDQLSQRLPRLKAILSAKWAVYSNVVGGVPSFQSESQKVAFNKQWDQFIKDIWWIQNTYSTTESSLLLRQEIDKEREPNPPALTFNASGTAFDTAITAEQSQQSYDLSIAEFERKTKAVEDCSYLVEGRVFQVETSGVVLTDVSLSRIAYATNMIPRTYSAGTSTQNVVFIKTKTKDLVDGDQFSSIVYLYGTHTFLAPLGMKKTVHAYADDEDQWFYSK